MNDNDLFLRILDFIESICIVALIIDNVVNSGQSLIYDLPFIIILFWAAYDLGIGIFHPEKSKWKTTHTVYSSPRHASVTTKERNRDRRIEIEKMAAEGNTDALKMWLWQNIRAGLAIAILLYQSIDYGTTALYIFLIIVILISFLYHGIKVYTAYRKAWTKNILGDVFDENDER